MPQLPVDWAQVWSVAEKILLAWLLAMPTGLVRERQEHGIGIRTFPIVAMASCAYLLLFTSGTPVDLLAARSRVLQGLIAGIGFVGGGAILKDGLSVHGTATAASIWNTAAIGASVALGRFEIAILLSILNLFTMKALVPLKMRLDRSDKANARDGNNGVPPGSS
ncbi:MAG TPA: MgtC/SapB family protein [Bryobacteraceae bacterium]|jgi:putative Mg2+ transporter-C (MgtC) family protein|nr:MgtC/SapB family protein [Bryobacteraceae bacterium]